MKQKNKLLTIILPLFIIFTAIFTVKESRAFEGKITSDNINVRSDSTVSSEAICNINKGDRIEIVSELYDWYKIKLPKVAPSFIKKEMVSLLDGKNAKVTKDNVNIRLRSSESSPILGKAEKNELINILEDTGAWYRIEPINNSFGWVHNKFVEKTAKDDIKLKTAPKKQDLVFNENSYPQKNISIQGIVRPKTVKRIATHKLINENNEVFLLKGNKEALAALSYHKVTIIGKLTRATTAQGLPIIEITKIEALN